MANKHTKIKPDKVLDVNLYIFSNNPEERGTLQHLQMFYRGAFENTIGIMRARNKDTGSIESILVGVDVAEGNTRVYPLAKILDPQEALLFQSPDGQGGYFTDDNS